MEIVNSNSDDIENIFRLYKIASDYQTIKNVTVWPVFDRKLVEKEISEKRQFKLVIDSQVACVFAITYEDEDIWEERSNDTSIYIHRIACDSNFRGNNYVKIIVDWIKGFAKDKKCIRLDTCGNNLNLIKHYENCGFTFLGLVNLKNTEKLPPHYHNTVVCLFEIIVE
jgi:ribosomal protein S18 acetylase RimI-like enzyme